MSTRFDLEQALQELWQTSSDLKIVSESVLNGDLYGEELANMLVALEKIHLLRCQKADDIFEELIENGSLR